MKTGVEKVLKPGKGQLEGREVLSTVEVAVLLRMKPTAIYHAVKNGILPSLKLGNRLRFSREAILKSLDAKRERRVTRNEEG